MCDSTWVHPWCFVESVWQPLSSSLVISGLCGSTWGHPDVEWSMCDSTWDHPWCLVESVWQHLGLSLALSGVCVAEVLPHRFH
jgi:hypothetical protein